MNVFITFSIFMIYCYSFYIDMQVANCDANTGCIYKIYYICDQFSAFLDRCFNARYIIQYHPYFRLLHIRMAM